MRSIDDLHQEMTEHFQKLENYTIPSKIKLYKELKEKRKRLKKTKDSESIPVILEIEDQLRDLKSEIAQLKSQKERYLLDNSEYINQYFEDKQNALNGQNLTNVKKVNHFFKIEEDLPTTTTNNNKLFYDKYMQNVCGNVIDHDKYFFKHDVCQVCFSGEMIPQDDEGVVICNNNLCGQIVTNLVAYVKPSNNDTQVEVSYSAYVRLNHFKEILSQFQAKETTQIPPDVVEKIKNRIRRERIEDISKITIPQMRALLQRIGLNRYFEHVQYINLILGIKPPVMNEELIETLCVLFVEIQAPWTTFCPPTRTNFFNYAYILYQLCTLLGQTKYLPFISLMKDRDKQVEQDMVWKKVCEVLDWEFIPST